MRITLAIAAACGLGLAACGGLVKPLAAAPVVTPPEAQVEPEDELSPDACLGAEVFVSDKQHRECCELCSMGDDTPSQTEINEAKEAAKSATTTTNNVVVYSSSGFCEKAQAQGGAAPAGAQVHHLKVKQNRYGGLAGLGGLSVPKLGVQ